MWSQFSTIELNAIVTHTPSTRTQFSSTLIKSSISTSLASLMSSDFVRGLLNRASSAVSFVPRTWRTLKSNSQIHASQRVTKAPRRSKAARFNQATSTFASVLRINQTPYSQYQTFLRALRTPLHSLFVASYTYSTLFQDPLLYLEGCRFPSVSSCINTPP